MSRMIVGRKPGCVSAIRFSLVALALLLGGSTLRAGDIGAGPFEYANGLRASVFSFTYAQGPLDLTGSTYTNSLTRVFTGGKAGTVLAMTEVAGKNFVFQGPANSWNEFGGSPGDNFAAALSGRFYPPVTGTYTFRWSQDDKGWLFMDMGNDGVFDSSDVVGLWLWNCTATRTLTAGQGYNFIFFSQDASGGESLAFWYTPPGGSEVYVCPSAQPGQWRYATRSIPLVSIDNAVMDAGAVTDHSATLKGNLSGLGSALDVCVCWGRTDGGSVAGNWETVAYVGPFNNYSGPVSLAVDGLAANAPYYYTFFATNASARAWATPSLTFVPGEVTLEATDASASETGDAGNFRVTRPAAATNSALTVYYTLGGTAANGADYASLPGSVTIPVGSATADIAVAPIADSVWSEGNETVTATLAAGNYTVGAANSATVTIQDAALSADDFSLRLPIRFAGYNRSETLTNFPALVTLGANLSGFSYSQFLSGANGDLRFVDDSMTRELPYEIEKWDATGLSRVWVQVPRLTNNATIWMLWRKSGQIVPAYTTNGTVWSEGYVIVAHHSESFGTVYDSTSFRNNGTQSGLVLQDVPGAIAGGDLFDGVEDYLTFGTAGRAVNTFSFSAWIQATTNHEVDAESNSSTAGTAGQKWAFECEQGSVSDVAGAGLSVGTNGISVYELSSGYMPPLAVYQGNIGTNWNQVTVTYSNRVPRIFLNGQLVRTGLTSPRIQVNSPYRLGGTTYGYFAGAIDETRVSSVARSGNWVWAEYMNAASNGVLATYGASQTPARADIANLPASGVSGAAATLNGYLVSTGMAQTAVAVYWGATDGGTDAGAWANTNWYAAPAAIGAFTKDISGLSSGTTYFFRYAASNAYGVVWAASTETLLTGSVTLQTTDATAAEYPLDTGAVTVSRGVALDAPLTVHYTLSGNAANGTDMSYLSGAVTIPAGAASADIVVAPLYNRNYLTRATDTVTLTLTTGGYVSGSPSAGTVTITNWQPNSTAGFDVPRNFIAASAAPLTGSEMFTKTGAGQMMVGGSVGNTFSGDITVDTDGYYMRVGAIPGAASGIGVTLPNMTAANTITVKRGGTFQIEDNANGSVSSAPNRFGTDGNRPAVALNGGTLILNGANYNAIVPQTLGKLSLGSGYSTINAIRASGVPQLIFSNVSQAKGSHVNFTSSSGTAMGITATNTPLVRFTSPPALVGGSGAAGSTTLSIMPGARYTYDWVTHDGTMGIRALTNEYNTVANNDINAAGATENVRMTNALTAFPPLNADKTVNSLLINVAAQANWTPTNKLTLTSGQLMSGVANNQMVINYPSTLTVGSGSDASLDVMVGQNNLYLRSYITDNGSGRVALTKNGGGTLIVDGSVDNTYSGGTYINEGTLNTGGTQQRRNLGSGPVRVDAGVLWLAQVGATANVSGDDYVAVNGGQIGVATTPFTSDDTFNIGPGCVIYGSSLAGSGLNSLDRGFGVVGATPNITLAPDAIIAHSVGLLGPLNLATNTVKNLGTNTDLYYGLQTDQAAPAGAITIGTGTPFKGLSTDRSDRRWSAGTINVTPGTSEITFQSMARPGTTPGNLYVGHWTLPGAPVIAPAGPLTVNILGNVVLDETGATYGDTSAGKPVTFAVKAGATLIVDRPDAMGSGSGLASARIEDGGTLNFWMPSGVNGLVTVAAGGRLNASLSGGLTGTGAITMSPGSVLEVSSTMGFTGPQADAIAASLSPGQLVRLNADYFGSPVDTLDSHLGAKAPIYEIFGGDRRPANPLVAGTTVLTLNRDATTGLGGMLVNDYATRSFNSAPDGILVIGPNGGTIAATTNTILWMNQPFSLGANALTIGATDVLDRVLMPKLGSVYLNVAFGLNSALPGSSITVIPGATLQNAANAIPDAADMTVNGLFLVSGTETIGSLGGSGWVNLQGNTLNAGRNNKDSTFSGTLTNTSLTAALVKTGTGRMDITSRQDLYSGLFTVNGGVLALSGNGTTTNTGLSAYSLYDSGTLLLDNSTVNKRDRLAGFAPGVTFNSGTFRFVGKSGEASGESLGAATLGNGAATIDIVNGSGAGSSVDLNFGGLAPIFGTVNFTASNGTLGSAGDNPRVFFDGLASGLIGFATVGSSPAYYSSATGVRAYTLGEGTEFNGTVDQTGVDTKYTASNNHLALNALRPVSSLWIDSPGAGNVVNLGSSSTNSLSLSSGRLQLTGGDDFAITRSGTSSGTLTRTNNGTLFIGVGAGRTLTMGVPIANGWGWLEKDGAGTLMLSATNSFTGTLSINEGTVRYATGYTNDLNGNAVNIWNSGVLDFAGDVDTLGAVSIYSGGITNSAAYGALTLGSLTMGGGPAGSSTYVNSGTGTNRLAGNVTFSAANDPDKATIAGRLDLNGGTRTFTVNNSVAPGAAVDMEISAVIGGAATYGITKAGAGVLKLSGSNTFDGAVSTADGCGTIIVSHPQALGAPSAGRTITINNVDTLALDGSAGNIIFPANYTNLFLNGAGDNLIGPVRGALTSVAGSNTVACPIILTGNSISLASLQVGGSLVLSGNISGAYDLSVNGDGNTVLGGAIATTSKALTKNGAGTLTLSGTGTNTFSGTTTVNDGKLVLAKASGSVGVNAIAGGAVTINDGGILQYAASSANPDMIGTGTLTINQTGQLDFNGASDGIGPLVIASPNAIRDTTPVLNSAGGGNLAVNGLTVQPAHGFLTRIDTGTGTLTLSNNVTFNAATTGRALISGKLSLANATRTFTVNSGIHSNYDLSIDAAIDGTAGTGLTKAGGGLLRLGGANTAFDGVLTLSGGTVVLGNSQALGVPSVVRTNIVSSGYTLALDGADIYDPNGRIVLNLNGTTGDQRINGTMSGALVSLAGSNTVPCAIVLAGGTQVSSLKAGGTLVLSGTVFGGGYALTVAGAGVTALAGANGVITNVSGITVSQNATLSLQNTAVANKADRIANTIPITLAGGALRLSNDGGAANFTETLGALTINPGSNAVSAAQAASGQTSALVFASMTWAGGTVNFTGEGLGVDARNRIYITGQADGMIGPWAFINGTNLAFYSSTKGVYAGTSSEIGIAALGGTASSVIPNNEGASAVINTMGSEGPISLEAQWTNRIFEVRQETAYASVVAMTNDTATKALQTSRLMIKADQEALTIGQAENSGSLMALWSGGALSLENWNASKTLSVNAAIANNGAASSLAKFGPGPVLLTGSNSYSGATLVNEGSLEFSGSRAQKLIGAISGAGTLIKSGTNLLHLAGTNTFTGPLYVNAGIVRPDANSAFGAPGGGVFIAAGAVLDVGCDTAVGGTRSNDSLNMGAEEFTVSGAGADGTGALVNNGNLSQMSSVQRVLLSGDTTFGGKNRWDIRSGCLFMNDHTLTKTGACEIALVSIPVYPGSGRMVINQNLLRFESSLLVNGSASNSVTVNSGAKLELYNLAPFVPLWSLILNEGSFFQGSGTVFTTNINHWAGPVKLNGRTFVNGSVANIQWSIDGDVSGTGTLVKAGISSATLWLNGTNNTYSGGTVVSNGTLYAKYPSSLPGYNDGRLTLANDGFVAVHASDGTFGFTAENIRDMTASSVFTTNTAGISIDTSMSALNYSYGFSRGPMALIKQGTNTLTLSGSTNTYGGHTYVNGGTLRFASVVGTNSFSRLYLGYNVTNAAAVVQEGGYVDCGSTTNYVETLAVGSGGTGSYGYYRMNGGSLSTGWLSVPGNNGYNGAFDLYGGDVNVVGNGSWLIMGWVNVNNGASAINLFGGRIRNNPSNELSMNHNGSRNSFNMINLLGPTAVLDAGANNRNLRLSTSAGNMASVVNLNSGTIIANRVYAGNTNTPSILNFNGGTLRASTSHTDFLLGLTAATVYPGGAVFDTAGSDVTVGQPLLAPIGYGLTYVPLRSNGANYIGSPVVVITGGSGTGATAIATVNLTEGSPTKGSLTGITVTSPGSGYLPNDKLTVTQYGGGTITPAITNDCLLGLNDASGGLTKLGLGTLTLAATNTYGGATVISNGMLQLAVAQALPTGSVVKVHGGILNMGGYAITNRSLDVTAGSVINGKLVCDSVVKTGSGKLTLGTSLASATPIIVSEGTFKLQSGQPGLYEGTLNGSFDTTDPASMCSNVTVQLGTRMANTNIKQPTGLWGDFMTIVYSGYIWNRTGANATWTFGESVDDSTLVKIDSTVVINGGVSWDVPTIGTYTLTPGAHAFEVRFGNGPGGAGLVPNKMWWTSSTLGFGIDYQGHTATNTVNLMTNFVACTDPGDGSLFSCTAVSTGSTNLIDAASSMVLGEGTLLDLDSYVQTLKDLSGYGTVSNGILSITGTIAPGGTNAVGALTIARNTTLNSGKLLVDVAGENADKLIVQGNANLANMTLEIANPAALDRTKAYTILTSSGTLTGKITPINLPDSRWHVLYRSDGSVQLRFTEGTLIRLR